MDEKEKVGMFEESNGNRSSMRLMCFISLLASIAVAMITLLKGGVDGMNGLYLASAFLLGAFCPKAIQKFAELKMPK